MSENTAPATETAKAKPETKQVSALIPLELHSALAAHRWAIKAERLSDVMRVALEEYAANHKLLPAPAAK